MLSFPIVLGQLLMMTFGPMALIFCGQLGAIHLACAALSTSLINVTVISVVMGLSAACDTLYAQTYGSDNKHKLGILVQRGILLLLLCLMPCFGLHVNTERFLIAADQDPVLAHLCGDYMLIAIPGIAAFSVFLTLAKYVQCHGVVVPIMLIFVIANAVCGILHYVLMLQLDMGTNGSAWAITAGYCTLLILTLMYIFISGIYKDTWSRFDFDCFLEWGQFLKLAYAGLFMMGLEWWTYEVGIFMAGILRKVDLEAQSIVFNVQSIACTLPFGVGYAASIRVGQYLGGCNSHGAKTATKVACALICVEGFSVGIFIWALCWQLPKIFSHEEVVIKLAANALPVLSSYMIFYSINSVLCGILRGMGRQKLGSCIIICIYLIALGSGIPTLMLSSLGMQGWWVCLGVCIFVEFCVLLTVFLLTNWDSEVKKAIERTNIASHGHQETIANGKVKSDSHLPEFHGRRETAALLDKSTSKLNMLILRLLVIVGYVMVLLWLG